MDENIFSAIMNEKELQDQRRHEEAIDQRQCHHNELIAALRSPPQQLSLSSFNPFGHSWTYGVSR